MHSSRRKLLGAAGLGGAAFLAATAGRSGTTDEAVGKGPVPSGVDRKLEIISLGDVEAEAHRTMSKAAWAFVANGSGDQWTLGENRRAFNDYPIATHRLRGVEGRKIGLGIRLLGHDLPYPIIVAPSGVHVFAHPKAEAATASGAGRASALYTASGASHLPLEQIAAATAGPKWFQAYLNADDGVTKEILLRAKNAGFTAVVLTADAIGPGMSDEFVRMGLPFPPGMTFGNNDPRFGGQGNFLTQTIIYFVINDLCRKWSLTSAKFSGCSCVSTAQTHKRACRLPRQPLRIRPLS